MSTLTARLTFVLAFQFCLIMVSSAKAQFFPPDAIVEGKTIPEWVVDDTNWQTFLLGQDPPLDTVNVHPSDLASIRNDGPVFFIAGLDFDNPESTLLVPPGRPILQRIFATFAIRVPEEELDADGVPVWAFGNPAASVGAFDPEPTLAALIETVDGPPFSPFFWEYDGVEFTQEQISSGRVNQLYTSIVPDAFTDADGVVVPAGEYPMSATSGIHFMHEPFQPGEGHTVKLGSIGPDGERFPEFTVHLRAIPEPGALCLMIIAAVSLLPVVARRRRHAPRG